MQHDATSGFHDIKPLKTWGNPSTPIASNSVSVLVGVLLFLLLILAILRLRKKSGAENSHLPRNPYEEFQKSVSNTKEARNSGKASIRDALSRISNSTRSYIEGRFHFPAQELTAQELEQRFESALQTKLPNENRHALREGSNQCVQLLKEVELLVFRPDLPKEEDCERLFSNAIALVEGLELLFKKAQQEKTGEQ